jgi:Zn-dependent peptidase ImmA (M78 family)
MDDDLPDLGPRKKVSRDLASKLIKEVGIKAAPVSLQQVIEHIQTTRALSVQKIQIGEKVSGLIVVVKKLDDEYATIGFNANHPWCRRRFTIAHEIGHLFLDHGCVGESDGSHNEREAHIFAAELLMPKPLLKKDYVNSPDVPTLAKLYRVSEQALSIQLMETRII